MEKKYKIGEFAKNLGVSVGFLKHHEQDGILRPEVSGSGYRYYSYDQAVQVFQCLRLQSLGFDSREVAELLNHSTDINLAAIYNQKQEELQERIRYYTEIVNHLKRIQHIGVGHELNGQWNIIEPPPFLYMEYSENGLFYEIEDCQQVITQWNQFLPMIMTCTRIQWEGNENAALRDSIKSWHGGLMIDQSYADQMKLFRNEAVRTVVPGLSLIYHHECVMPHISSDERDNYAPHLEAPIQLCCEHHFTPRGDIYISQGFVSISQEENYISEVVMVPVI